MLRSQGRLHVVGQACSLGNFATQHGKCCSCWAGQRHGHNWHTFSHMKPCRFFTAKPGLITPSTMQTSGRMHAPRGSMHTHNAPSAAVC